jgi:hypothetical protein
MARPRIFISSTFFDLRQVRADLEAFARDLGYDTVANERGDIPYGNDEALEEYCYKEIENADIVVSIVGGRFGTQSSRSDNSISNMEVRQAIDLGRQLYIFVDANVHGELRTYKLNKKSDSIKYAHAYDKRIFEFLEEIELLKSNNTIFPFREASEIVAILREQWAGLFQRLLRSSARQEEIRIIDSLKSTAQSLEDLMKYAKDQTRQDDKIVTEILLPSHPIFARLSELTRVNYRLYFQNMEEFKRWLTARGYKERQGHSDRSNYVFDNTQTEHKRVNSRFVTSKVRETLIVSKKLFSTNGDLKYVNPTNWDDELVTMSSEPITSKEIDDDDIPF